MQKHIFSMRKHKLTFSPVPASSMQKARICPIESVFGRLRRPGGPVFTGENKRGRDTKVSLPLLTPQPFLRTRLPPVARLKTRGPQGRLVLQGSTLDGSGAFRSAMQAPCTVWPRTVMRGTLRKKNSGHNRRPQANRRTEPSSRNPRFAAHLRCVRAKEGLGSQEGTGNHWCPVPFCLRRQTAAPPAAEGGHCPRSPRA